jgi:hypothetical protein
VTIPVTITVTNPVTNPGTNPVTNTVTIQRLSLEIGTKVEKFILKFNCLEWNLTGEYLSKPFRVHLKFIILCLFVVCLF